MLKADNFANFDAFIQLSANEVHKFKAVLGR